MPAVDKSSRNSRQRRCINACDTCKRRKEKCDGYQPCGRCITRRVQQECVFNDGPASLRPPVGHSTIARSRNDTPRRSECSRYAAVFTSRRHDNGAFEHSQTLARNDAASTKTSETSPSIRHPGQDNIVASNIESLNSPAAAQEDNADLAPTEVPQLSRLLQDSKGEYMFIGDSSNLSFLHIMRRLISRFIGDCAFVNDPVRHHMVEASPGEPRGNETDSSGFSRPMMPDRATSRRYLASFFAITREVFDMFDETDFVKDLDEQEDAAGPVSFLVFAIGAQTCPDGADEVAETYFNYGRHLTNSTFMEEPSITTVQLNILITMYLLNAARRNAAFMYLGIAVRAAYALGVHREDVSRMFPPAERETRETLWKVIRVLDLFLSTTLGRPPSTFETRAVADARAYHPSLELCTIFEKVLTEVYSKRMVSSDVFRQISERQKTWTTQLSKQWANGRPCNSGLDIGLLHLQADFYLSVILLTRPYLIQAVSAQCSKPAEAQRSGSSTPTSIMSNKLLVHACVDSAIRSIKLHICLLDNQDCPRRHPFIVNSLFASTLVVGFAFFANLNSTFPLSTSLDLATSLLRMFTADNLAVRFLEIAKHLQNACNEYVQQRTRTQSLRQGRLIEGIFGSLASITNTRVAAPLATTQIQQSSGFMSPFQHLLNAADIESGASDLLLIPTTANTRVDPSSRDYAQVSLPVDGGIGFDDLSLIDLSPQSLHFDSYDDSAFLFPLIGLE